MSAVVCKCDQVISLTRVPSDDRYFLVSERNLDRYKDSFVAALEAGKDADDAEFIDVIGPGGSQSLEVILCPNCERLHVYYRGNLRRMFKPDDEKAGPWRGDPEMGLSVDE